MTVLFTLTVRRRTLQAALCLALVIATGCNRGNDRISGKISGRITFKGTPVTAGVVNFMSKTLGVGASANLGPDGAYKIEEPLEVGVYQVMVTPPPPPPPRPEDGPPKPQAAAANIPAKYRAEATSDLKATIEEGENVVDFDLLP